MKRKVALVFGITALLLLLVNPAYAESKLTALTTDIKILINGNQVNKQALIINGSTYLPVRAISESLGLEVNYNTRDKAIYLSSPAMSSDNGDIALLQETIEMLQKENGQLKAQISSQTATSQTSQSTASGAIVNTASYGTYISPIPNVSNKGKVFQNYWSQQTPFKVNGTSYSSEVTGFSFPGNDDSSRYASFGFIKVDNSSGKYRQVTWLVGKDDLSSNTCTVRLVGTTLTGTKKILTGSEFESEQINQGFTKYTVSLNEYNSMSLVVLSPYQNSIPTEEVTGTTVNFLANYAKSAEGYAVVLGPYVK